jgi:hypothetical protein
MSLLLKNHFFRTLDRQKNIKNMKFFGMFRTKSGLCLEEEFLIAVDG